jgi:hypothetical protein
LFPNNNFIKITKKRKELSMKTKFIFIVMTFFISLKAQENLPALITDRPDQTESSTVVPYRSLQVETGFVIEKNETDLFQQKSYTYNSTLLRYGILENFELRLGFEYLGEEMDLKSIDSSSSVSGMGPLYTGFKVKIAEEQGWKPEMAFLGGLVLPFSADENFKPKHSAANIRFSFAHTLSERFSLGYNAGAEWDGETAVPGYFYSLVLGVGVLENLGMFLESYGLAPEEGKAGHLLDAGFTYLVSPNFQLDLSGGGGLNDVVIDHFLSFGLTYRFLK